MPTEPIRERPDACPGATQLHPAADGGLARIRIPGGTITKPQLQALADASAALGDGQLELTSRANVQIRAIRPGAEAGLTARLHRAGLLPSATHERVRNIIASPLGDDQHLVDALDQALQAEPDLAELPGRFLVTVDDGRGDVSGFKADIGLQGNALLLAGTDTGIRTTDPVATVVQAAQEFQRIRGEAWRLAEVPDGIPRVARTLGTPAPDRLTIGPPVAPPVGSTENLTVAAVPLGRLTQDQARHLCEIAPWVRITPWRSVVVPTTAETGLVTDPGSPWLGVTACAGRPGCAKSLADVRADAARWVVQRVGRVPVHWSGCARRCGKPAGRVVEMIATGDGYRRSE